jgi:hypothetical protein
VDWIELAQDMGQWPESCEDGNEPSGFRKCEESDLRGTVGFARTAPAVSRQLLLEAFFSAIHLQRK